MIEESEQYDILALEQLKTYSEKKPDSTLLELITITIEELERSFRDMLLEKDFMYGAAMACNGKLTAAFYRLKEKVEAEITSEN